jgi:CO/xanthine dehydrogenase FAD-binding subunit
VGAGKESEFLAALLVSEAEVQIQSSRGSKSLPLAGFLRDVAGSLEGGIVTAVSMATSGKTASARVGRTPADQPIVAAAARLTPSGQIYLALCGVAASPVLVDPNNVKGAINPPADFRGSSEYRRQVAATLAKRVVNEVSS